MTTTNTASAMANEGGVERFYADRDHEQLREHYIRHVQAMTAEGLHAKSDIAAELAATSQGEPNDGR